MSKFLVDDISMRSKMRELKRCVRVLYPKIAIFHDSRVNHVRIKFWTFGDENQRENILKICEAVGFKSAIKRNGFTYGGRTKSVVLRVAK